MTLAVLNLVLASYNVGSMWTLQLMHYPLYAFVGAADFREYIAANNRHAVAPAILPGLAALVLAIALVVRNFGTRTAITSLAILALNVGVLLSSARLQARMHAELAKNGRDDGRIARLVSTNWIRTVLTTLAAAAAAYLVFQTSRP